MGTESKSKIGAVRLLGTQRYECVGDGEPYTNRFGATVLLHPIETMCPDCGRMFRLQATVRRWRSGELTRRCEEHRRPGLAVKPGRVRPGRQGKRTGTSRRVVAESVVRPRERQAPSQWPQSLIDLVE